MKTNKKILAIDPGSNGAMVFEGHELVCRKITSDKRETCEKISFFSKACNGMIIAFVEDVGKHMAGNAASGSIALARNHQNIKTCLYMLGIETVDVSPQKWTKEIGVQVKDERSKEEKLRVRNLPKAEKDRENGRLRKAKKAQKNEKIREVLKSTGGVVGENIPDYTLDAYGIYLYAKKVLNEDG